MHSLFIETAFSIIFRFAVLRIKNFAIYSPGSVWLVMLECSTAKPLDQIRDRVWTRTN